MRRRRGAGFPGMTQHHESFHVRPTMRMRKIHALRTERDVWQHLGRVLRCHLPSVWRSELRVCDGRVQMRPRAAAHGQIARQKMCAGAVKRRVLCAKGSQCHCVIVPTALGPIFQQHTAARSAVPCAPRARAPRALRLLHVWAARTEDTNSICLRRPLHTARAPQRHLHAATAALWMLSVGCPAQGSARASIFVWHAATKLFVMMMMMMMMMIVSSPLAHRRTQAPPRPPGRGTKASRTHHQRDSAPAQMPQSLRHRGATCAPKTSEEAVQVRGLSFPPAAPLHRLRALGSAQPLSGRRRA